MALCTFMSSNFDDLIRNPFQLNLCIATHDDAAVTPVFKTLLLNAGQVSQYYLCRVYAVAYFVFGLSIQD